MWHKTYYKIAYLLSDLLAGGLAWSVFFCYRKLSISEASSIREALLDPMYYVGIVVIPLASLIAWNIAGSYHRIFRRSRLNVIYETTIGVFIGSLVLLFTILTDDTTLEHYSYVRSFLVLFSIHWIVYVVIRLSALTTISSKFKKGQIQISTIGVGKEEIINLSLNNYHKLIKVISTVNLNKHFSVIKDYDEILIAHLDRPLYDLIKNNQYRFNKNQVITVIETDLADSQVISSLDYNYASGLYHLHYDSMPLWQNNLKRILDIFLSCIAVILLLPMSIIISLLIKIESKGEVIFEQVRLGKNLQPFKIKKFRSMVDNAEEQGPQLSYLGDERITQVGKILRRYRLDEIPQFINVIQGDMSLVGPRPERQYFIEQLKDRSDYIMRLYSVKPGITSWGQVKFGYASNVDQILQRAKFDLLYLENRSLFLDFKIMFYTISVLLKGKGH